MLRCLAVCDASGLLPYNIITMVIDGIKQYKWFLWDLIIGSFTYEHIYYLWFLVVTWVTLIYCKHINRRELLICVSCFI